MDKMMGDMSSMMEKSIENASHFQHVCPLCLLDNFSCFFVVS